MQVELNRNLFYILAGLVSSGANTYDHNDTEISALAEKIVNLDISENIKSWFSRARTGQVEVNPYWPRGSAVAAACFFIQLHGVFDIDACFSFFDSTGAAADPIGDEDFRAWISDLPKVLSYFEEYEAIKPLWDEYCHIVNSRMPKWNLQIDEATKAADSFFAGAAPEMYFSPNLFAAYNADFVRIGNRITTISSEPDVESMLHETLHMAVAVHREKIMEFSRKNGLMNFADRDKMMEFGYMADDSVDSIAHVIEECFVRAVSVVLANKNDERLNAHVMYGCDGVPFIALHFKNMKPTVKEFGEFIDVVLECMAKRI